MALKKFAVNMVALTAARMLQTVSSFLAIPILARLLSPEEFGLIAMASTFVVFTMAISDAGLGQTLVRVPPRERDVWSSAFWFISGIGLVLSLLLVAIALPTAWFLREPDLTPIILALAPLPLVQASLSPALADLQQREQFRHLASIELFGSLAGTFAAIGLALAGFGVWALVAQQVVYWIVKGAIVLFSTKFWPSFVFKMSVLGPHIAFSRDTGLLGIVSFLGKQLDPIVIGRLLGTVPVGLYSVATRIAYLPMQFLSMPLQNALFTRMVMLREDKAASRNLMLVAAWVVGAIVFPGMAVGAAAAGAYFHVFLSEKWLEAAPIFTVLAPTLAIQCIMSVCGTMLLAIGATGRRLRLNIEFTIAWLIVLPFAAMHSVFIVAAAYTVTYALMAIRTYPMYFEPVGCTVGDVFKTITPPIVVSLVAAGVHYGVRTILPMDPVSEVLVSIAILLAAYAVLALVEWRKMGERIGVLRSVLAARGMHEAPVAEPDPV